MTTSPVVTAVKRRFPEWLKKPVSAGGSNNLVNSCVDNLRLNTVCSEARCPNRGECFSRGTATFLILGNSCTRSCGFCTVTHGKPEELDQAEPLHVAQAALALGLKHIVITSVTRDDLPLGGAAHFAETIRACKQLLPTSTLEVLIPDFQGDETALRTVLDANPDILNHNIETIERLYSTVRPQANYKQSLKLLDFASKTGAVTKSGIMVGLGETPEEVVVVLQDLRKSGCTIATIGQYLQPSGRQIPVVEYIRPEIFKQLEIQALRMGFTSVFSGPFVRSSYRAEEVFINKS